MPTVALDTRDAFVPMPHGSGIYARRLAAALRSAAGSDGLDYWFLERGGRAHELWWEQVTLPRLLRRRRPALVHAPNCFLPLRRPCPGVVTVHDLAFEDHRDDFSRRTGWKYRTITRRAARSAERVICVSHFTRDDVCARYGVDPERTRVVPIAPALPGLEMARIIEVSISVKNDSPRSAWRRPKVSASRSAWTKLGCV